MRSVTSGTATTITFDLGVAAVALGVFGMSYGYLGGKQPPPYHFWRTPGPLDRPAYVRQQTEPYNEKLGHSTPPVPAHLPPMRSSR
jgi:hypothetical protein